MKIKKFNSIVTHIKNISEHKIKNANGKVSTIIVLNTEDGNFSNFANIWEKQKIDVEALSENDDVEIQYTTFVNPKTKHEYKNFMFVTLVEPTLAELVEEWNSKIKEN